MGNTSFNCLRKPYKSSRVGSIDWLEPEGFVVGKSSSHGDLLNTPQNGYISRNRGTAAINEGFKHCDSTEKLAITASPYGRPRQYINYGTILGESESSINESGFDSRASSTFGDSPSTAVSASAPSTPQMMMRRKPPPKPPRMRSMRSVKTPENGFGTPSARASGRSTLRSSIQDFSNTLDSSLSETPDVQPVSRISPLAFASNKFAHILNQTKDFLSYEIDIDRILTPLRQRGVISARTEIEIRRCKSTHAMCELLFDILATKGRAEFSTFCEIMRNEGNHGYLADLLLVLDTLIDIAQYSKPGSNQMPSQENHIDANANDISENGIASASFSPDSDENPCSACKDLMEQDGDDILNDCSSFDIEISYVDIETGVTKDLKQVALLKKRRVRPTLLTPEAKLLIRNDADRYIPVISLSMYNQCLARGGIDALTLLLETKSCIRELSMAKNHIGIEGIAKLAMALQKSKSLYKLDLRLNTISDKAAYVLSDGLKRNRHLKVLNVTSTELTGSSCGIMLSGVLYTQSLFELDVGFNDLQNEGSKVIADMLANNCSLRKLRMRDNYVTGDGAYYLFKALKRNSRLSFLDMSSNRIGDKPLSTLSEVLLHNRTLRELNLENCKITYEGCKSLARALRTNTVLRALDLSMNPLGDTGVEALADGLKYNQVLDTLCFNMCSIGNQGFYKLLDSLHFNVTMQKFKLCYNCIGKVDPDTSFNSQPPNGLIPLGIPSMDEIYEKLCITLQQNKDLKVLLWGNQLEEDQCEADDISFPMLEGVSPNCSIQSEPIYPDSEASYANQKTAELLNHSVPCPIPPPPSSMFISNTLPRYHAVSVPKHESFI